MTPDKKRESLLALHAMLQKHDIGTATDALGIALSNGVKDADSILASYHRLTSSLQPMQPMQLKLEIQMPALIPDNKKYDNFFDQEVAQ